MTLSPELFVTVLAKTKSGINLLDANGRYIRTLSPAEAAACMGTGNFMAVGRPNRVRYVRALNKDAALPVERSLETDPTFWEYRHLWTWSAADFGKAHLMRALDGLPA